MRLVEVRLLSSPDAEGINTQEAQCDTAVPSPSPDADAAHEAQYNTAVPSPSSVYAT